LPEERRAFGIEAVEAVDDLGAAMLTAVSGYGHDVPFMISSVWIDETGTGGEGRLLVGGIGATALAWIGFTQEWSPVLERAKVPHAHLYKMERNEGPFSDREVWGISRKMAFAHVQFEILKKYCQFGITVSLDLQLYNDVYRRDFPAGVSPDSAYGVACKELILATQAHCERFFKEADPINFVVEEGHRNFPNVEQIFRELKLCYPDLTKNLGTLFPMNRDNGKPLQAIDQLIVMARRSEPQMLADNSFVSYSEEDVLPDLMEKIPDPFPIFYQPLTEERLRDHRDHKAEMAKITRRLKNEWKAKSRASGQQS
jgi:hypothetical protein